MCVKVFVLYANYLYIFWLDNTTPDGCFKFALGYLRKRNKIMTKHVSISETDFFQNYTNQSVFYHSILMMLIEEKGVQ